MRWLDGTTDSMDVEFEQALGGVIAREACVLQSLGSQRVGHD